MNTYISSLAFMSSENVSEIGVMASFAVFAVMSRAPVIIPLS